MSDDGVCRLALAEARTSAGRCAAVETSGGGEQVPAEYPGALGGRDGARHRQGIVTRPLGHPRGPVGQNQPLELGERSGNRVAGSTGGMSSARVSRSRRPLGRDTGLMSDGEGQQRGPGVAAARRGDAGPSATSSRDQGLSGWRRA